MAMEGKELILAPGTVILYREGTPQYYGANHQPYANDWCHLTLSDEEVAWLVEMGIPMDQPIHMKDTLELSLAMNQLSYDFYTKQPHYLAILDHGIKLFFYRWANRLEESNHRPVGSHYQELLLLRSLIFNQPYTKWTIEEMARGIGMSRSSLGHLYQQTFGVSPMDDVISSRLNHAKFLIDSTQMPIKKIAEICGYESDIHFMRQFKSKVGMTPTAYRHSRLLF